jgi:hypothetical protein
MEQYSKSEKQLHLWRERIECVCVCVCVCLRYTYRQWTTKPIGTWCISSHYNHQHHDHHKVVNEVPCIREYVEISSPPAIHNK